MEQKITIQSDGDPIDHDKALAEAIQVISPEIFKKKIILIINQFFIVGSDRHES